MSTDDDLPSVIPPLMSLAEMPRSWLENYARDLHQKLVKTHVAFRETQRALRTSNQVLEQTGEQLVKMTKLYEELTEGLPYPQEFQKAR